MEKIIACRLPKEHYQMLEVLKNNSGNNTSEEIRRSINKLYAKKCCVAFNGVK